MTRVETTQTTRLPLPVGSLGFLYPRIGSKRYTEVERPTKISVEGELQIETSILLGPETTDRGTKGKKATRDRTELRYSQGGRKDPTIIKEERNCLTYVLLCDRMSFLFETSIVEGMGLYVSLYPNVFFIEVVDEQTTSRTRNSDPV